MTVQRRSQECQANCGSSPTWALWRRTIAQAAGWTVVLALTGCALVDKPLRPAVYDFGPGVLALASADNAPTLRALSLPEVEASSALDSSAVLYRLAYTDSQQLQPYAHARWSMAPAQLVRQRLRDALSQQRVVLNSTDGNITLAAPSRVLNVELEEFSQLFDAPSRSYGLVRLRATLTQPSPTGDTLLGQRSFVVQRPAPTADAPGGVRALTAATDAVVQEVEQWLKRFP